MTEVVSIKIDGRTVAARTGETVLRAAERAGVTIPTLCDDKRLDPAGACRACLVEVKGQRRLQPSCHWQVQPDMEVSTDATSERVKRHQNVLVSMYMADHRLDDTGLPVETAAEPGNALRDWAKSSESLPLEPVDAPRVARPGDKNPYITFQPDLCVLCARCTRYCDEVEGVNAITLTDRGSATTIGTSGMTGLLDTTCELCGGCIDTCPTGALVETKSLNILPRDVEKVRTTCNYCGVGCQMDLNVKDDKVVRVTSPEPGTTLNDGNLCIKGRFAYDFIHHQDRFTEPMVRGQDGKLHPTTWEHAIQTAAEGLKRIARKHGQDAIGFVSSSRCTGEENYLVQKIARAAFATGNVHQCSAT
ncbi:MAG: 2Fe-2S iron-sulfur cluster binding domain-containing protein [Myxococcales bacterium FL481]|nr:MAG: 2Fe-2S iron-sulfur cluster binding domain-containing protein [Myxococcales bacterium FL481]